MDARSRLFTIGDVHGQLDTLIILLRGSGLVDRHLRWMGGMARLWFMGDFFDRGPEGIEVVDLIMRLQTEASGAGGEVGALVGNHEVLLLAAHYFPDYRIEPGLTFSGQWENNLGQESDLAQLTQRHIDWLANLPALTLVDGSLLVHADSFLYTEYGRTIAAVNKSF